MDKKKAIFNWSGGKDSSMCLHKILEEGHFDISCLLTSVNAHYRRVSMHGVRVELLEQQAECLGLPLEKLMVPEMPTMETYNQMMYETLGKQIEKGVTNSIFGDIFLEDLRKYREEQLARLNIQGVFPLWKKNTTQLIEEFISLGFKAIIVCVNEKNLDRSFAGRFIDKNLLKDLPDNVDPCGENGEYHSFVFDGPIFKNPIPFTVGETVYKKYTSNQGGEDSDEFAHGFWYTDLIS